MIHRPGGAEKTQADAKPFSAHEAASTAGYIADMAGELAALAGRAGLPMLTYFLNLARVEAEIRARELGGPEIRRRA
jgi:hypothetical protein